MLAGDALLGARFLLRHFCLPILCRRAVGLSALTLMDRRLELAIGVHAANNIGAVERLFSSPNSSLHFDNKAVPWWGGGFAAEMAIIYFAARWIVRRAQRRLATTCKGSMRRLTRAAPRKLVVAPWAQYTALVRQVGREGAERRRKLDFRSEGNPSAPLISSDIVGLCCRSQRQRGIGLSGGSDRICAQRRCHGQSE